MSQILCKFGVLPALAGSKSPKYNTRVTNKLWQIRENGIGEGILYAVCVLALGAYSNYSIPYDSNPATYPQVMQFVLWALLYVPIGLMVVIANWNITEFGFHIKSILGLVTVIIILLCGASAWRVQIHWQYAIFEAFARTGEEIFFRGFLFALLLKIFSRKTKPWIWAVSVSAFLFSLVHTQTFQTSFLDSYGSGSTTYKIIEGLLNVFLMGLFLALLRHWTNSILPGAIMHSMIQGGIFTLPFCLGIYGIITLWAFVRKESVFVRDGIVQSKPS
jgi:membrane protease YdiL (CAAX protease family)